MQYRNLPLAIAAFAIPSLWAGAANAAPIGASYIAPSWNNNRIYFLDANMKNIGSFPTGEIQPNAVTASESLIFSSHFTESSMYAYDYSGRIQYSWTSSHLVGSGGIAYVNGLIATGLDYPESDLIAFLDPRTGALVRTIPCPLSSCEGLAFDGSKLWVLGGAIIAVDPNTGAFLESVANPAFYTLYHGTGISKTGPNELTVVAPGGEWYKVSTSNSQVLSAGINLVDMYDLAILPSSPSTVPEPGALACLGGLSILLMRRRK